MLRLRQLVLAAHDLPPAVRALEQLLDAPEPYADPDIAVFGLTNRVVAAGTDFVEVISPKAPDTAVGRWLARRGGDGGYMLMVDGERNLAGRERLAELGIRVVHEVELPDVVDVHLHPKDTGGVLLALDAVDPTGSWRWAGPAWTGRAAPARGGLRSVTVAVDDPDAVARRWAQVLELPEPEGARLVLDDGRQAIAFVPGEPTVAACVAATLALPVREPRSVVVAGVALDVVPLEEKR